MSFICNSLSTCVQKWPFLVTTRSCSLWGMSVLIGRTLPVLFPCGYLFSGDENCLCGSWAEKNETFLCCSFGDICFQGTKTSCFVHVFIFAMRGWKLPVLFLCWYLLSKNENSLCCSCMNICYQRRKPPYCSSGNICSQETKTLCVVPVWIFVFRERNLTCCVCGNVCFRGRELPVLFQCGYVISGKENSLCCSCIDICSLGTKTSCVGPERISVFRGRKLPVLFLRGYLFSDNENSLCCPYGNICL